MSDNLKDLIDSIEEEVINIRRDLHQHPELGWEEVRTASIIAEILEKNGWTVLMGEEVHDLDSIMGLPTQEALDTAYERALQHGAIQKYADRVKGGKTGVIGILKNGDGPTTALRFDMDALGLEEVSTEDHFPNQLGFRSQNKNRMHACGHDGHVSIGLGLAKVLPKIKDKFCGEIKLIFQPGEEGVRGAKSIVDKGYLDDVDYILSGQIMNSNMEKRADFY